MSKYKKDIIRLRKQGKSYREIENELGCSRGNISYHCKQAGLEDIGKKQKEVSDEKKKKIREHYKSHTREKTAKQFDVSESTVQKYGESEDENSSVKAPKDSSLFENEGESKISYSHLHGHIAEQKVATEALKRGYVVSEPIVESRYDLLIDNGEEIKRVQVKYSDRKRSGSYEIILKSECRNNGEKKTYSKDEIDAIIAYIGSEDSFAYIPPEIFETQESIMLRFDETKNNQRKGVNFFDDYAWK